MPPKDQCERHSFVFPRTYVLALVSGQCDFADGLDVVAGSSGHKPSLLRTSRQRILRGTAIRYRWQSKRERRPRH